MNLDRRVRYTRMVLKDSLLTLMKDRPIERISVKEICEKADINRSTFYVHYGSPKELLDSIKDDMYDEIKVARGAYNDVGSFIKQMCDVFYAYRELLQIITRSIEDIGFLFRVCGVWKEDFLRELDAHGIDGDTAEIMYLYISNGACAAIVVWATGGFRRTSEEMAEEILRLVMEGLGGYIRKER